ncbi:MAG: hypothetical protein K2K25_02965 [Muribaculaceae bacterium]|nr:hypothetical protein [Muribaculaceae bacterium]
MQYHYNKLGSPCSNGVGERLTLVWHKTPYETYCHHAYVDIPYRNKSLFSPSSAWVTVNTQRRNITKKKTFSYDEIVKRLLNTVSIEGNYCRIKLNSPEILDALCLNDWTYYKNGSRNKIKAFPYKISVELEGEQFSWDFEYDKYLTPFLICEKVFSEMSMDDKIEITIHLSET